MLERKCDFRLPRNSKRIREFNATGWLSNYKYHGSMHLDGLNHFFQREHCSKATDCQGFLPKDVKENDRFEIKFDFIQKECSFYWNRFHSIAINRYMTGLNI